MITTINIGSLIVKTQNICGNRPHITGKRISVEQIIVLTKEGLNPQEIIDEYKKLTLAEVYAALTYYYLNQQEIEKYLTAEKKEYETLLAEYLLLQ